MSHMTYTHTRTHIQTKMYVIENNNYFLEIIAINLVVYTSVIKLIKRPMKRGRTRFEFRLR